MLARYRFDQRTERAPRTPRPDLRSRRPLLHRLNKILVAQKPLIDRIIVALSMPDPDAGFDKRGVRPPGLHRATARLLQHQRGLAPGRALLAEIGRVAAPTVFAKVLRPPQARRV